MKQDEHTGHSLFQMWLHVKGVLKQGKHTGHSLFQMGLHVKGVARLTKDLKQIRRRQEVEARELQVRMCCVCVCVRMYGLSALSCEGVWGEDKKNTRIDSVIVLCVYGARKYGLYVIKAGSRSTIYIVCIQINVRKEVGAQDASLIVLRECMMCASMDCMW